MKANTTERSRLIPAQKTGQKKIRNKKNSIQLLRKNEEKMKNESPLFFSLEEKRAAIHIVLARKDIR